MQFNLDVLKAAFKKAVTFFKGTDESFETYHSNGTLKAKATLKAKGGFVGDYERYSEDGEVLESGFYCDDGTYVQEYTKNPVPCKHVIK